MDRNVFIRTKKRKTITAGTHNAVAEKNLSISFYSLTSVSRGFLGTFSLARVETHLLGDFRSCFAINRESVHVIHYEPRRLAELRVCVLFGQLSTLDCIRVTSHESLDSSKVCV